MLFKQYTSFSTFRGTQRYGPIETIHRQDKWIEEAGQETGTTEEEKCAWKGEGVEVSLVFPCQYV